MSIKRVYFFILCLTVLTLNVVAASGIHIGFLQGYVNSTVNFSPALPAPVEVFQIGRIQGGLFLSLPLGEYFSIQPELNYTQKGMSARMPDYEERWNCDFLEIPLLLRIHPLSFKDKCKLSLFAGPYAAFRLSINQVVNGTENKGRLSDTLRSLDLGVTTGVSLGIKSGSGLLHFEVRYSHGFTNLLKDADAIGFPSSSTFKLRSMSFLFGYSLPLGK